MNILKTALVAVAILGLVLSLASGLLVLSQVITYPTHCWLLVLGMLMWFGSAIFWVQAKPLGD